MFFMPLKEVSFVLERDSSLLQERLNHFLLQLIIFQANRSIWAFVKRRINYDLDSELAASLLLQPLVEVPNEGTGRYNGSLGNNGRVKSGDVLLDNRTIEPVHY